jgi:hypothetical protein
MDDPIDFYPYTTPDTTRLPELALQTLSDNISAGVPTVFRWYVGDTWHVQESAASNVGPQVTTDTPISRLILPFDAALDRLTVIATHYPTQTEIYRCTYIHHTDTEYQKGFVTAVGFSICQVTSSGELAILQLPDKAIGSGVELRIDGVWTLMMVNNEPYADQVSEEDAVGFERLTASWVVRS